MIDPNGKPIGNPIAVASGFDTQHGPFVQLQIGGKQERIAPETAVQVAVSLIQYATMAEMMAGMQVVLGPTLGLDPEQVKALVMSVVQAVAQRATGADPQIVVPTLQPKRRRI